MLDLGCVTFKPHPSRNGFDIMKDGEYLGCVRREPTYNHLFDVSGGRLPDPILIVEENMETAKIVAAKLALGEPVHVHKIPDDWYDAFYHSGMDEELFLPLFV